MISKPFKALFAVAAVFAIAHGRAGLGGDNRDFYHYPAAGTPTYDYKSRYSVQIKGETLF